jgi:polyhydroxyalkanoate synthesis regulator phasin
MNEEETPASQDPEKLKTIMIAMAKERQQALAEKDAEIEELKAEIEALKAKLA